MTEWIGGRNAVYETLTAGRRQVHRLRMAEGVEQAGRLAQVLALCRSENVSVETVPRSSLDPLAEGHQGVALETGGYPYADLEQILAWVQQAGEPAFLLLLDSLQDPQNFGALLRTAESVGVHGVLLPYRRTASVTPAVVKASSGASEHLLIGQANLARAMARMKEQGIWLLGLVSGGEGQPPAGVRFDLPLGVVVGNESQGMRRLVRESCDMLLTLPMRGRVDSLNAAVAGSVALFLAWQARGFPGAEPLT